MMCAGTYGARALYFSSFILYDEDFHILGRGASSENKIFDADDSLFDSGYVSRPMYVPYESSTAGGPTGSDDFVDIITAGSENFYEADETAGETLSGTNFKDTAYGVFTTQDVGKNN